MSGDGSTEGDLLSEAGIKEDIVKEVAIPPALHTGRDTDRGPQGGTAQSLKEEYAGQGSEQRVAQRFLPPPHPPALGGSLNRKLRRAGGQFLGESGWGDV